jgi:hypothetical protein
VCDEEKQIRYSSPYGVGPQLCPHSPIQCHIKQYRFSQKWFFFNGSSRIVRGNREQCGTVYVDRTGNSVCGPNREQCGTVYVDRTGNSVCGPNREQCGTVYVDRTGNT